MDNKSALWLFDIFYAAFFAQLDACGLGSLVEAVDDGLRIVRSRKHAAIWFGFDRDAACGEPIYGVLWLPAVKGAE